MKSKKVKTSVEHTGNVALMTIEREGRPPLRFTMPDADDFNTWRNDCWSERAPAPGLLRKESRRGRVVYECTFDSIRDYVTARTEADKKYKELKNG
jgi:hypothetical protein